jgi:hypothetical protein
LTECEIANHVKGQVVEPLETIETGEVAMGVGGEGIPLFGKKGEALMHVDFELFNGFRGEGVRNGFALSGVFDAVAGGEDASSDGYEYIVEISIYSIS